MIRQEAACPPPMSDANMFSLGRETAYACWGCSTHTAPTIVIVISELKEIMIICIIYDYGDWTNIAIILEKL